MIKISSIILPNDRNEVSYVRLAQTPEEITEAQKIRYAVFYDEYGAQPCDEMRAQKRDFDDFDDITDHLIVLVKNEDTHQEKIVGTYRLLRQSVVNIHGCGFYSDSEYNLQRLIDSPNNLLELGRSCVLPDYRTKPILNLLWQGIADYITEHKIDILFGCASFHGTSVSDIEVQLSYLHHYHKAPNNIAPTALEKHYVNMNILDKNYINERRTLASLPPLVKGYLRLGASIGHGAVIDQQFNTIDVCIVVQTHLMTERYRKHYERKIQRTMPGQQTDGEAE